jgi:hypothetical protein
MTRSFRAIRFPFIRFAILTIFSAAASLAAPASASASPGLIAALQHVNPWAGDDSDVVGPTEVSAGSVASLAGGAAGPDEAPLPAAPPLQADLLTAPSIETTLHHFYCVEYARLRSGVQIFGDAKTWWQRARNIYAEFTQPETDAVMVFAGNKRIARGHLAVVTRIVSPREIRVDQANWQNHGEIDRYTPVLDVSANNDWSKVRVWDMRSGQFGVRTYPIKGFIARALASQEQASADIARQGVAVSLSAAMER